MNRFFRSFTTRSFRAGGVSLIMMAVVVALAVLLNVAVALLPTSYTKIDLSQDRLFAMSDAARELIASYSEDIEIMYIVEEDYIDTTVQELLLRAAEANPRITLNTVDPGLHPELITEYNSLSQNSFVVRSAKREKAVNASELYQNKYYMDGTEIDESTYQQYYMMAQYGMSEAPTVERSYAGESVLASAIDYVCTDTLPVVYAVSGHNELSLEAGFAGYLADDNVVVSDLQLATSDSVPEDAAAVIINTPQADLSQAECQRLDEYMKAGGHVVLYTYYQYTDYPNLEGLLNSYGMRTEPGIVMETESDMYDGTYYRLFPQIESHEYTDILAGKYIFAPLAHGILTTDTTPEGVSVSGILSTSKNSFARVGLKEGETTIEQTDADAKGPFYVGAEAVATEGGKLTWYSTPYLTLADYDSNGAASDLFLSTVESNCQIETSVSLATKPITVTVLSITDADRLLWGFVLIALIPVGAIVIGLVAWSRRRKR